MSKIWREKLKEVMAERGLKAKPLSISAGLNETYVWDLLNRNVDPTLTKMAAIADVVGLRGLLLLFHACPD
jgi:transcriptional regulator with XRE-family HTH domain